MSNKNLLGLAHIGVYCKDIESSVKFYTDLGFEAYHKVSLPNGMALAFLRAGSCIVELIQPVDAASVAARGNGVVDHFCIEVADCEGFVEELKGRGVEFLGEVGLMKDFMPGMDVKNVFFEGPDKERIEFFEYIKK